MASLILTVILLIVNLVIVGMAFRSNKSIENLSSEIEALGDINVNENIESEKRMKGVEESTLLVAENVMDLTKVLLEEDDPNLVELKTKPDEIQIGATFETIIDCAIIGLFFYKDRKFAVITPMINDKHIAIPSIVGVDPDGDLNFNLGNLQEDGEIMSRAFDIYSGFKAANKDSFLTEE